MRCTHALLAACVWAAVPAGTRAQVLVNGDFETGGFPPWSITNSPGGRTLIQRVVAHDIDGPTGPRPSSMAAQFMVGRVSPAVTGPQGIELLQTVTLQEGRSYRAAFDWSVHTLVNVYGQSGGLFEFMADGESIVQAVAPVTQQGVTHHGRVEALFTARRSGTQAVGVRVRRDVLAGEEVLQHLDHIDIRCAGDWNADGIVDFNDFLAYLNDFNAGNSRADLNGDGIVDFNDLLHFLNLYMDC